MLPAQILIFAVKRLQVARVQQPVGHNLCASSALQTSGNHRKLCAQDASLQTSLKLRSEGITVCSGSARVQPVPEQTGMPLDTGNGLGMLFAV